MINSYKELKVWQKAVELVEEVYILTSKFPKEEVQKMLNVLLRKLNEKNLKPKTQNLKPHDGFTLIEVIIVIAITAVFAASGIVSFFNYRNRQNFKLSGQEIVEVLRNAQNRSTSQEDGARWGVYFENPTGANNDFFDLFSGTSYSAGAAVSRTALPAGVQFDIPVPGASSTIIFAPVTGIPSASTTIKISLTSDSLASSTIIINANGTISF